MTLKHKYAHLPPELRNRVMLVDIAAYMDGKITLRELHEVEYPLNRDAPKRRWWQRLAWWTE